MTPDNRQPRKRRRRRRRPEASFAGQSLPHDGGMPSQMSNSENPQGGSDGPVPMPGTGPGPGPGGPGGGGRRRRRSRHRRRGGGGGMMPQDGTSAPIEVPSGELFPTGGVLYIKPNGTGLLVKAEKNYV